MLNKPRLATEKRFGLRNSLYMLTLAVIGAIFEVVMNTAVLMVLYNRPKLKAENTMRTTEIKLFIFTLLISIWQMIFLVLQIFFYIDGQFDWDIAWTLFGIQQYIVDLMSLSPPFFLLMMSSDVQKYVWKTLPLSPLSNERRSSYKIKNLSHGTDEQLIHL
uniref:Serpentine receptor class gamma n=1 Tax=Acrobeloides nanus TaxID=290746 RepID=A0A914C140_9BILA